MIVLISVYRIRRYIMSIGIIGHVNPNYLANLPGLSTVKLTVVPFVSIKCLWEIL